jgi:hypothetical protein
VAQGREQGAEQQGTGDAGQAAADDRGGQREHLRHDPGLGVAQGRGGVDLRQVEAAQPAAQLIGGVDLEQGVAQDLGDHVARSGHGEERQRDREAAGQPEAQDGAAPHDARPDDDHARPPDPAGPAAAGRADHRAEPGRGREQAERGRAAVEVLGRQGREQPGGHPEDHRAGVDEQHAA